MYEKSDDNLVWLGNICLEKEFRKNQSFCQQKDNFDYHGIEKALCGKEPGEYRNMYFTPKRILVIQMK